MITILIVFQVLIEERPKFETSIYVAMVIAEDTEIPPSDGSLLCLLSKFNFYKEISCTMYSTYSNFGFTALITLLFEEVTRIVSSHAATYNKIISRIANIVQSTTVKLN